ncbi:hypothetical protein B0T26DRAFT_695111, partial [Lasiosphaeria miniovina]
DLMDSIFGTGARDELFSPVNGIFLYPLIERAFDRGFLVIDWETITSREYRIIVVFSKELYNLEFNNLAGLHGGGLQFLNESRPRARYVWWTFLNAITQLTWKGIVLKGTRYWGTHGRYVKKNMLLGFVKEIGHDVSSIAESIMEHAIEEEEGGPADQGPDKLGLAVKHDGFDYEFELEDELEDKGESEEDD